MMKRPCTVLYHVTTRAVARCICENGFRDGVGYYGMTRLRRGVWLSEMPLDENEGAEGDTVLRVVLRMSEGELERYEVVEEGKPYREWLVPARVLNRNMRVEVIEEGEA